jgi:hypothetical protein
MSKVKGRSWFGRYQAYVHYINGYTLYQRIYTIATDIHYISRYTHHNTCSAGIRSSRTRMGGCGRC